jgi:transketolase
MEIPVIFIFTHDSIGVGEDGPTHQPVEQLISLRAIPGLIVMRPGEANEVAQAWRVIVQLRHEPVCLILSRQNMPTLDRTKYASASGVARGAYILADAIGGRPDVILIGTGSDVSLCVDAYEKLTQEGIKARVSVEQASVFSWDRYARLRIGMHTFGASAPLKELQNKFGFTPDAVAAAAREELAKAQ